MIKGLFGNLFGVVWITTELLGYGPHPVKDGTTDTFINSEPAVQRVTLTVDSAGRKVSVYIDGDLFTAYLYSETISKPVLYPLRSAHGLMLTRGFPLEPKPGERIDHPHHVGSWLNYGNVNGLDFWNNSEAIAPEKKYGYGTIHHRKITEISEGEQGTLEIEAHWDTPAATTLLIESTRFVFGAHKNTRFVERTTTLTAIDQDISFKDNKEGMMGIRVARALELPTDEPAIFTDARGIPTKVKALNNEGVHGDYLSSEGLNGNEVWGTRARWVMLSSQMEGKPVALVILDHPDNVGYPTYWHARGYGLFAANPLGQSVFSNGHEELNFTLKAGTSVTFKYKVLVHSGSVLTPQDLENEFEYFYKNRL